MSADSRELRVSLKQLAIAAAVLGALAAATYAGTLANGYALDAVHTIRDNPLVQSGSPAREIFRSPYWDPERFPGRGLYRPLSIASFWLTRSLFAQPLPVDQGLNVLLQLGCSLVITVLLVTLRVGFPTALLLSALYLVHPVQSEAVAGLVGRSDLLATLFALLALCLALWSAAGARSPNRGALVGLFLLSMLSLLSKESAATLFLLVPVCVGLRELHGEADLRSAATAAGWTALPLLVALALNLTLRQAVLGGVLVEEVVAFSPEGGSVAERWGALAYSSLYLEKLLWPHPLLPDYATGVIESGTPSFHLRAVVGLAFGVGSGLLILRELRRVIHTRDRFQAPVLGLLLFWIAILPVSNLLFTIGTRFGERLLHLPLAFLLLVLLCGAFSRRDAEDRLVLRSGAFAAVVVSVGICAWVTSLRVPAWRDNRSLFERAVADAPGNYHARMSYATTLVEGEDDEYQARDHFLAAVRVRPEAYAPHSGLGKLALGRGDFAGAREHFVRALSRAGADDRHLAQMNLALAHRSLGEDEAAELLLRAVVRDRPDFGPGRKALGDFRSNQGRTQEALSQYERALERDPTDVGLWQRVIWAHLHLGHGEMARRLAETCPPGTLSTSFAARLAREGVVMAGVFEP